jgi:5-hydroxyisourate hydrolase
MIADAMHSAFGFVMQQAVHCENNGADIVNGNALGRTRRTAVRMRSRNAVRRTNCSATITPNGNSERYVMGKLTTHILDTARGVPCAGLRIELFVFLSDVRTSVCKRVSNADGRCDEPLLEGDAFEPGEYELEFHAGEYFARQGIAQPTPRFVDRVSLRFGIADAEQSYHVPLLVSPWSYSTYRGS